MGGSERDVGESGASEYTFSYNFGFESMLVLYVFKKIKLNQ